MYKYFSELERLRDFKTYLIRDPFDKQQDLFISNMFFPDDLLKKMGNLFPKLNIIDELIIGLNEDLMTKSHENNLSPNEAWSNTGEFFQHRNECYFGRHYDLKEKVDFTSWDLLCLLNEVVYIINYLVNFYPDYRDFLLSAQKEIRIVIIEIKRYSTIKIPPKSDNVVVNWPNSWYITPNGYLYNTGCGHKTGNLVYSFSHICNFLEQNRNVPRINYYRHIRDILKRGYVSYEEFRNYSNLVYRFPTIFTPEILLDMDRHERFSKMSDEEYEKIIASSEFEWPHPKRSYQKNLITLVIGHLAAETSLYSSFARMNGSRCKDEIIKQLERLTTDDIRDVLVRFSGFHKIESIVDHTITTSSLNGITEFSEYLKRGWDLHIIPRIVYDKSKDRLSEIDFSSRFVSKHLDSELAKYEGKGKILIKEKDKILIKR